MRGLSTGAALAGASALLFLFVACGGDDPADPGPTNPTPEGGTTDGPVTGDAGNDAAPSKPGEARRGSRLAPKFRTTSDGFERFSFIVDTQLANEHCYSSRAADGVLRCLPAEALYVNGDLYADDGCTTRIADTNPACAKPTFANIVVTGASCDTKNFIHDVGAEHTGAIYRKDVGAGCVSATKTAGRTYYVVGAERPASSFVKFTEGTEEIAGGVGVRFMDGEDGSHFPQDTLVTIARTEPCALAKAADGKDRCLPANAASVYGYVDSACMTLAGHASETCDPFFEAKTALYVDQTIMGANRVYELGAKQATPDFYNKVNDTTCDGPASDVGFIYALGAEIPAATFPEISTKDVGGTRIVTSNVVAGGVSVKTYGPLQDLMLDVRCSATKASDGKLRCVPQGAAVEFSDDQCTQRHIVVFGAPTTFPKYAIETDKSCPQVFKAFPVGAEVTPTPAMTYANFTGTCVGKSVGNGKVYAVGAEVPPTNFAEVTEVVR